MNTRSLDTRFGELRSLIQAPTDTDAWSESLVRLLLDAHGASAGAYESVWVPYMAGFGALWASQPVRLPDELVRTLPLECDLSALKEILPFAKFALHFGGLRLTHERLDRALETARTLEIDSLVIERVKFDARRVQLISDLTGFASPKSLAIRHTDLGRHDIRDLATSGLFERIESLDLERSRIGTRALMSWSKLGDMVSLRSLRLEGNDVGDLGAAALIKTPRAPRLRDVSLAGCPVTSSGMKCWMDGGVAWTELDLGRTRIGEEGVMTIANSARTQSLTSLDLSGVRVRGNSPYAALFVSENVHGLEHLNLSSNGLGWVAIDALCSSYSLRSLRSLDLSGTRLGFDALSSLLASRAMRHVKALTLVDCNERSSDIQAIASGLEALELERLDVGWTRTPRFSLTPDDLHVLSNAPGFERLESLGLARCGVDAEGIRVIVSSERQRLGRLVLTGSDIGEEGVRALIDAGFVHDPDERGVWSRDSTGQSS